MANPIPAFSPAISRRSLLAGASAALALSRAFPAIADAPRLPKLTIWGPPGPPYALAATI